MAFPTTSILDDFNRADEGPPPSASWSADSPSSSNTLRVVSNACYDPVTNGGLWGTQFGPDSEVYTTLSTIIDNLSILSLYLRLVTPGSAAVDGYQVRFIRNNANPGGTLQAFREDNQSLTQLGASITDTGGTWTSGMKFGIDMISDSLTLYLNRGSWVSQGSRTDSTYTASGYVGMRVDDAVGVCDDFGGGTIGGPPPAAAPTLRVMQSGLRW